MAYSNGQSATFEAPPDAERLPPHNLEAEECALGSILIDPDCLIEMTVFLRPADFYRMSNRWLYAALVHMHNERIPIDFLTVASEMRRREQLDDIGGEPFLINLVNVVPTSIHAEYYARLVADAGQRRRMIDAAGRVAKLAWEEGLSVDEMVSRSESAVFAASASLARDTVRPSAAVMSQLFDITMARHDNPELPVGLPSGLLDVDRLLGGFKRSDMIILAARPGMGKTALALGLTLNAVRKLGKRVAFFSLEMSAEQLARRLVAMEADIAYDDIEHGRLDEAAMGRFNRAVGELSSVSLWIDDSSGSTMPQIASRARRLYAEHGLDLVVIDYVGLIGDESGTRYGTTNDSVAAISKGVKGLARELDIPILTLSQLSRNVEGRSDKRPMLSDLRDSGCLSGDALVTLADSGERVPIRSLVGRKNFSVWALNTDTYRIERAVASKAFSTGVKQTYRLTTALGKTIVATGNHPFFTIDGWSRLDGLKAGAHVAMPRSIPDCGGCDELDLLATSDVYWDKVVSVDPAGPEEVFDLTVPGLHNFVADDIFVHNSLEQDSDVTMFIYRDDYYNPDTSDRPNIAELIVAKHRNGRTGIAEVFWKAERGQMCNLNKREISL